MGASERVLGSPHRRRPGDPRPATGEECAEGSPCAENPSRAVDAREETAAASLCIDSEPSAHSSPVMGHRSLVVGGADCNCPPPTLAVVLKPA